MKHLLRFSILTLLLILGCTKTETIVQPAEPDYKEYVALITQHGDSAPSAVEIKNTIGTIPIFGRMTTGTYTIRMDGRFTENKTYCNLSSGNGVFIPAWDRNDVNTIIFNSILRDGTLPADNLMNQVSLEIRVYN